MFSKVIIADRLAFVYVNTHFCFTFMAHLYTAHVIKRNKQKFKDVDE